MRATTDGRRVASRRRCRAELERRKRRLGVLGFDDLLEPARRRPGRRRRTARGNGCAHRWSIVLVDEFQDTDPVQWDVLAPRLRRRQRPLVLIGDPKQAIYAFRGGDIVTYLDGRRHRRDLRTLDTNWRSDEPLVSATHAVLRGASLGDDRIQVRDVPAHHTTHRLADAPHNAPFRLRLVTRQQCGVAPHKTIGIDRLRDHISADLAADVKALLASRGDIRRPAGRGGRHRGDRGGPQGRPGLP